MKHFNTIERIKGTLAAHLTFVPAMMAQIVTEGLCTSFDALSLEFSENE